VRWVSGSRGGSDNLLRCREMTPARLATMTALALATSAGCHHRAPEPGGRAAPILKSYAPFDMAHDVNDPRWAVVLGAGAPAGATLLAIRPVGQVQVDVPGDLDRGAQHVDLMVASRIAATATVAGDADPWQLSGVLAATVAARALGKDFGGYAWRVTSPLAVTTEASGAGTVPGLAASAVLAAGFLAAVTGATVDTSVGIVASVLPDGSLAAPPGLPEAVDSLLTLGKRRLGVPAGAIRAASSRTGREVDLAALIRERGAELIPLTDVGEAYRLLTGSDFPGAVPLTVEEMKLPSSITDALARDYK
jgi:hypothetical protein